MNTEEIQTIIHLVGVLAIIFFLCVFFFFAKYMTELYKDNKKYKSNSILGITEKNTSGLFVFLAGLVVCGAIIQSYKHIQREKVFGIVSGVNPQVSFDGKGLQGTNEKDLLSILSSITEIKHHSSSPRNTHKLQVSSDNETVDLIIKSDSSRNNFWWVYSSKEISIGYIDGWVENP